MQAGSHFAYPLPSVSEGSTDTDAAKVRAYDWMDHAMTDLPLRFRLWETQRPQSKQTFDPSLLVSSLVNISSDKHL